MAHQLRELVAMSTKLIPHYLPTKVTGHDTPSLSILVGGEDARAEIYTPEHPCQRKTLSARLAGGPWTR